MPLLLDAVTVWVCPNCPAEHRTRENLPNRFHTCPGLRGLTAPLVREGTRCKVIAVEREDYVRGDRVQTDENGRPVMAVRTIRDEGEDVAVFAPTAISKGAAIYGQPGKRRRAIRLPVPGGTRG